MSEAARDPKETVYTGFKYAMVLGNKSKDDIRVVFSITKMSVDMKRKSLTREECEEFLRESGRYLAEKADFSTLTKIE